MNGMFEISLRPRQRRYLVFVDGVIVVDKPEGCTSHDVVNRLRRIAQMRRVGHLGTLDPLASGVLPLVIGRATRLAQYFRADEKVYDAVFHLGLRSDTYDRDGVVVETAAALPVARGAVESALEAFRGTFPQLPPPISAKKVKGIAAYKLARGGVAVALELVEVTVYSLEVVEFSGEAVRVLIRCSGGTYVRSIAHDLGERLGCGAIVERLRRTVSGDFSIKQARSLDELQSLADEGRLSDAIIPAAELLPRMPTELVDELTAGRIRQGRDFRVSPFRPWTDERFVKAVTADGELVAIGEARLPNVYHPILVL